MSSTSGVLLEHRSLAVGRGHFDLVNYLPLNVSGSSHPNFDELDRVTENDDTVAIRLGRDRGGSKWCRTVTRSRGPNVMINAVLDL
jgi:hypothetical protein